MRFVVDDIATVFANKYEETANGFVILFACVRARAREERSALSSVGTTFDLRNIAC